MQYCNNQEQTLRELKAPRRNNYYYGKMLDVLHLKMEQDYSKQMRWLSNRLGLGSGVLCGLGIKVQDGTLYVEPGAAVDPLGREILVPNQMPIDPWTLVDPCGLVKGTLSKEEQHLVTLYLCYKECLTDHAPVLVSDCDQQEMCEAGTVVESFRFEVRPGLPEPQPKHLSAECCNTVFNEADSSQQAEFEVSTTIDVGGHPVAAAATADGNYIVVANQDNPAPRVNVIRVADNTFQDVDTDNIAPPIGGVATAPEGSNTFVAHANGIAVINQATAEVIDQIAPNNRYGTIAVAESGDTIFAIKQPDGVVHYMNVANPNEQIPLDVGGFAVDVAVSSDSQWAFVAREDGAIVRFKITDTSNNIVVETVGAQPETLALRMLRGVAHPHIAKDNNVIGVRDGNIEPFTLQDVFIRDSAFTTSGDLYYVTSAEDIELPGQLVVYGAQNMAEVARVPVGIAPTALAIVPGTLRSYIANANSGTVTVVDGRWRDTPADPLDDPIQRLCHCTSQTCNEPDETCVPLAAIELRENGEIGRINECAVRPRVYSNQMLLEMIMCLAKRLDECCHDQPPQDTDLTLPKVASVSVLDSNSDVIRTMTDPAKPLAFRDSQNVRSLRVVFTQPMNENTIVAGGVGDDPETQSFLVTRDQVLVPGRLTHESDNTVRWDFLDENIPLGEFTVQLFGDADPANVRPVITDRNGLRLDGEPDGLPSGEDTEGGDFTFRFGIANFNPVDKSPKVIHVSILDSNNDTIEVIRNTNKVPNIVRIKEVKSIHIGFSDIIDPKSIVATSTNLSELNVRVTEAKKGLIAGKVKFTPPNQLVWTAVSPKLAIGNYTLKLYGDVNAQNAPPPIRGKNGFPLDGEPQGWLPSGNGLGGGNFEVSFKVTAIKKGVGTL